MEENSPLIIVQKHRSVSTNSSFNFELFSLVVWSKIFKKIHSATPASYSTGILTYAFNSKGSYFCGQHDLKYSRMRLLYVKKAQTFAVAMARIRLVVKKNDLVKSLEVKDYLQINCDTWSLVKSSLARPSWPVCI